jgi:Putative adhesin
MKTTYNFILALFFIGITSIASAKQEGQDFYREVRKSFAVNANVVLDMDVNFGNVTATSWDQNFMEILVKMNVNVKSEKRAEDIFRGVDITESAATPRVRVNPGNSNGKNESYDIYVEIKMPKSTSFTGSIEFGNFAINSVTGSVRVKVQYGNVSITEALSNDNDIDVAFGNMILDVCSGGYLNEQYGNVRVGKAKGNIKIQADFGNVEVRGMTKECKRLEINCDYGNIEVDTNGQGIRVDAEVSYGDIDMDAGNVNINKEDFSQEAKGTLGDGNTELELECSFGNIEVN